MNRHFYSWQDLSTDIKIIVKQISLSGWYPDFIVGVKRGGLIPASVLSHYMNLPLLVTSCQVKNGKNVVDLVELNKDLKGKRLLVVDDICDEGKTLEKLSEEMSKLGLTDFKACTIFYNTRQNFVVEFWAKKIDRVRDSSWVVFPWEV